MQNLLFLNENIPPNQSDFHKAVKQGRALSLSGLSPKAKLLIRSAEWMKVSLRRTWYYK